MKSKIDKTKSTICELDSYGDEHDQWIAESWLPHARQVIEDYWTRYLSQNL